MSSNRALLLAAFVVPSLLLTACSSSGGGNPVSLPGGNQTSGATHSVAGGGGSSSHATGGGDAAAWCQELGSEGQSIIALGGTSTASPSEYKAKLEALVNDSPADIRSDLQVLERIDEKIADGDTSAEDQISNPSVAASLRHVATWLTTNCPGVLTDLPSGLPTG
jgi:hypothetical protein